MNEFGENVYILDHPLITHKISILRERIREPTSFGSL